MKYIEQYRVPGLEKSPGVYGKSSSFRLHWDINTYCDKDCFYCYARKQLIWNRMSTKDTLDNILDQLRRMNKPLEVILLGGEPSLHPLYFYILDELEKLSNLVGSAVISNAGRNVTTDWIDGHSKYQKFWFNYTFDPSETSDINIEFLDKVKYTREKYENVLVNVMMIAPKWDTEIREVIDTCNKYDICIRPNVLFNPHTCQEYMITNAVYKDWISQYIDSFERYLYFSSKSLRRGIPGEQAPDESIEVYNDIEVYLQELNNFTGWKCLNNNYAVEGSNNTNITRMCDKTQSGEYMICPLKQCVCQGLLTNEKYK